MITFVLIKVPGEPSIFSQPDQFICQLILSQKYMRMRTHEKYPDFQETNVSHGIVDITGLNLMSVQFV